MTALGVMPWPVADPAALMAVVWTVLFSIWIGGIVWFALRAGDQAHVPSLQRTARRRRPRMVAGMMDADEMHSSLATTVATTVDEERTMTDDDDVDR